MSGVAEGSRAGFETARLALARLRLDGEDARRSVMRQLALIGAHALSLERVSIWLFEDGGGRLRAIGQHARSPDESPSVEAVDTGGLEAFLTALHERRVLAVADAQEHPATRDLRGSPLALAGTTARLDAPIIREGAVAGVVCHEHAGETRIWSQKERDFAASAADMAALFLEQADRFEIELTLRQRREEMMADEKMAALSRLARSVAHDMNNVFNVLAMTGATLEAREDQELRRQGDSIRRAVGLGTRLVEQLSLFGEESTAATTRVDLEFLLDRMRPVLSSLVRGVRLEIAVRCPAPSILAGASQIEQVLLNLCVNASEAIAVPAQGLIRIELREARADEPFAPASLVLTVEDNGRGMDAETQEHIFEPYFTRKEGGHGIGLSVVYGIVRRCRGTISVRSAQGAGTAFVIALPRALSPQILR
jgi:signal transduction histidine kinase